MHGEVAEVVTVWEEPLELEVDWSLLIVNVDVIVVGVEVASVVGSEVVGSEVVGVVTTPEVSGMEEVDGAPEVMIDDVVCCEITSVKSTQWFLV